MKKLFKIGHLAPLSVLIVSSLFAQVAEAANLAYRVSQETAPKNGIFASLGQIYGFKTTQTLQEYYAGEDTLSFNGPIASDLFSNTAHLFVVEASDVTGLFAVRTNPGASMKFDGFKSPDQITEILSYNDGVVYGNQGQNWGLDVQITAHTPGITAWKALSFNAPQNKVDSLNLSLVNNSRVRIESILVSPPQPNNSEPVPEPSTLVGLLAIGTLGGLSALKRLQK